MTRPVATGVFDITGPLPRGTTLLEASAGTGKTWTIAALVARYVAEGVVTLEEMLVVTFGRAASQELRERVRERLVQVEQALTQVVSTGSVTAEADELVALLLDAPAEEIRRRCRRVRSALTGFDSAAIVTIHQFCHTVLKGLGVAGDTDPAATLVEDLDDLLLEVVDDLYLRDHSSAADAHDFPHKEALRLARAAVADPRARLEPADADPASPEGIRVAFCEAVRREIDVRKRRLGVLSYDDLLGQLADALVDAAAPARQRMRQRWKVVLVDEFQDTDPVQWQVFDCAFSGVATMVLIGDPKQAIYAFRGGDVFTYLAAKRTAQTHQTLGVNRRSDAPLLEAMQVVLQDAELGDEQIVVRPVESCHPVSRLTGAGDRAFQLRVLTRDDLGAAADKLAAVDVVNAAIADDAAAQVRLLLDGGTTFEGRPLTAGDIAVIAHTRRHLALVQAALARAGVPAVVSGGGSVFGTPAAQEWLVLLEAMEQPSRSGRVRAAALTSFFGRSADDLVDGGDALTEQLSATVREWVQLFADRGVAAVFETAVAQGGLEARVLGLAGGERLLTDLRHVAESLHAVAARERLGLVALLAWIREQMSDDVEETATERTRRLDSDARAVQLVTVHGSKGLQYPVVLLPFASDRWPGRKPDVLRYHDEEGRRVVHVGGVQSRPATLDERHRAEDAGESLRLLYVAMTRAQSRLVAWWAAGNNVPASPLNRLLLGRRRGEGRCRPSCSPPADREVVAWLRAWDSHGGPEVLRAEPVALAPVKEPDGEPPLSVRDFTRRVDTSWRRTSYSALSSPALTDAVAALGVASEPEVVPRDDEAVGPVPPPAPDLPDAPLSPMAGLPVGATFGSLVHAVLEHADPGAPAHGGDLRAELRRTIDEQLVWWPQELDRDELADALVAVCDSPLGPLAGGATLRDVGARDRLCELDFELPLGGGDLRDAARAAARLGDIGPLLRRHLPEGDPVREYAGALAQPLLGAQQLIGYLTGSVDLVLRVGGRFLVVDYKTNRLGVRDEPLTAAAYTPAALAAAMGHSDYPLQALLYAVVLHRFLRWRLPGYAPESHLGGVLYLYLRGMCGPQTPVLDGEPCGVFSWRPPVALVEELSDLLDGVPPR
ncbi:MAG TPA: UvrD-helicase domain-containing protein [Marmoricola sp.]|nr:UvrD-helicase domain-containing protein [Marmoricola sp.]